ncbi:MAG: uracil-DNA glycosylase [Bacteriovoracaceae bacterium]
MNKPLTNCRNCKYFQITYDQTAPYGCKKFNMRSKRIPSQVVKEQSGEDCFSYEERPKKKEDSKY